MILRPVAPPVEYGITKRLARAGNAAIAILRSLGTSAHVWLPGASGVSVASLPSNNYLLSDGSTGYSTVDGVVGLDLDAMGALGSELGTPFDGTYTANTGVVCSGGVLTATAAAAGFMAFRDGTAVSVGKTYLVTGSYSTSSAFTVYLGGTTGAVVSAGTGTFSQYIVAAATSRFQINANNTLTGTINNISIKEYTGTHLTQATTANKPLVRRGMLNELLNSATPATQSVTCIAAPYTLALYGTGNVVLSGTGAGTLTGTGASDLVVLNFTPTAGSVTFTKAGTVSSFGLFKGTWTAAQILAEGGIPVTTATAASNPSAGKYWWSFDGSNDSLLSGNLGITNACTIVVAGLVNAMPSVVYVVAGEDANGVQVTIYADGSFSLDKSTVSTIVRSAAGLIVAGVPFVITARLSGGTAVVRLDGVQKATAATALTYSATTGMRIGRKFDSLFPLNGAIGWVVPLPVALSDADCLTVERLVGSQFPGMATF